MEELLIHGIGAVLTSIGLILIEHIDQSTGYSILAIGVFLLAYRYNEHR